MTATARRPRTPRRGALKAAPRAAEELGDALEAPESAETPKTLMGVGRHTAAATAPAPERGPQDCVLCGEHVDRPRTFVTAPDYPICPDIGPCIQRAVDRSPTRKTASTGAADHAPAPVLEQAPQGAQTALEPLPEMTP